MSASTLNSTEKASPIPYQPDVFLKTPDAYTLAQIFSSVMAADTRTLDGVQIRIAVETKKQSLLPTLKQLGSEGVGIFETDGIAVNTPDSRLPPIDEQLMIYQNLLKFSPGKDISIRTIVHEEPGIRSERLGRRGIRFSESSEGIEEFRTQLRATMCAAPEGGIKLLLPKVTDVIQVKKVREEITNCQKILEESGHKFNTKMPIGVIFEVTAAAFTADFIGKQIDFFHVRLSTYSALHFAADPRNEKVRHLIDPASQSFLRGVKKVTDEAIASEKPLSMSGFMKTGDNLRYIPLWIGLGAQELYPNPELLPAVKLLISRMKFSDAKALVNEALDCETSKKTISRCEELVRSCLPEFFIPQAAMLPAPFRAGHLST